MEDGKAQLRNGVVLLTAIIANVDEARKMF